MDFLRGKTLFHKTRGLVPAESLVTKNSLILYYFTGMDCHPCRLFDKKLHQVHLEAESRSLPFLVIVVCTDDDEVAMNYGLKNNYPNWYAVPFEDELRGILRYNYGVTHIPHLIVVRENGELVTRKGRTEIENIGINVLVTWPE